MPGPGDGPGPGEGPGDGPGEGPGEGPGTGGGGICVAVVTALLGTDTDAVGWAVRMILMIPCCLQK